jgi:methylated-DNA-[protein]-cysteine S-methyltransferase
VIPQQIQKQLSRYTPFQQAVWRACAEIPSGHTRTYGWIAARIGRPNAARAVGRALGSNPFAPTIPCHRVVAASGWGGYSAAGGVERKRRLIAREKRRLSVDGQ